MLSPVPTGHGVTWAQAANEAPSSPPSQGTPLSAQSSEVPGGGPPFEDQVWGGAPGEAGCRPLLPALFPEPNSRARGPSSETSPEAPFKPQRDKALLEGGWARWHLPSLAAGKQGAGEAGGGVGRGQGEPSGQTHAPPPQAGAPPSLQQAPGNEVRRAGPGVQPPTQGGPGRLSWPPQGPTRSPQPGPHSGASGGSCQSERRLQAQLGRQREGGRGEGADGADRRGCQQAAGQTSPGSLSTAGHHVPHSSRRPGSTADQAQPPPPPPAPRAWRLWEATPSPVLTSLPSPLLPRRPLEGLNSLRSLCAGAEQPYIIR